MGEITGWQGFLYVPMKTVSSNLFKELRVMRQNARRAFLPNELHLSSEGQVFGTGPRRHIQIQKNQAPLPAVLKEQLERFLHGTDFGDGVDPRICGNELRYHVCHDGTTLDDEDVNFHADSPLRMTRARRRVDPRELCLAPLAGSNYIGSMSGSTLLLKLTAKEGQSCRFNCDSIVRATGCSVLPGGDAA